MIIGVTGKKRAGKDTIADHLVRRYGFKRVGFADAVKEMALILDPVVDWGSDIDYLVEVDRLSEVVATDGWEAAKDNVPEVRSFLQRLGTDAVRNVIGANTWVDILARKIREGGGDDHNWVIPDVRFLNEAREVHYIGGRILRVIRTTGAPTLADDHPSEKEMDLIEADHTVWNTEDIASLQLEVDDVMRNDLSWGFGGSN